MFFGGVLYALNRSMQCEMHCLFLCAGVQQTHLLAGIWHVTKNYSCRRKQPLWADHYLHPNTPHPGGVSLQIYSVFDIIHLRGLFSHFFPPTIYVSFLYLSASCGAQGFLLPLHSGITAGGSWWAWVLQVQVDHMRCQHPLCCTIASYP